MSDEPGTIAELESSPAGKCLNEIVTALIDENLAGIEGNVWIRDPPAIDFTSPSEVIAPPCIVLSTLQPTHTPAEGTMTAPDFAFWYMATLIASAEPGAVNVSLADRLFWYHKVLNLFAKRPRTFTIESDFPGYSVKWTRIQPGDPRIIAAWNLNYDAAFVMIGVGIRYPSQA